MPSVFIKTYGCQMNERDSEAVAAQLVAKGYILAPTEVAADVILLNTCSVRDFAEQKAIGKMQNLAADVRKNRPDVVLGFLGCMAQSRGQELIDKLPDVDLVLGTQKFHHAADYLDEILAGGRKKIVDVAEEQGSEATIREHLLNGNAKKSVTAYVSIMQGCSQYCTFCIVPYTRGEERSRTIPDIVAECRQLVSQGVKEITLLGQIVTSYGKWEKRDTWQVTRDTKILSPVTCHLSPFVQLLDAIHEIEGLERIRFTAPHPKGYGDDLIQAYARLPKLVESAHLPVQSGSDRVLKLMHRGYTRDLEIGHRGSPPRPWRRRRQEHDARRGWGVARPSASATVAPVVVTAMNTLPDGEYPFIDERLPLAEMTMVEAPPRLEALFKEQAERNGIVIIRDQPVELRCRSEEYPDATFLIWWPTGHDRIHMLVPKKFATGRASKTI